MREQVNMLASALNYILTEPLLYSLEFQSNSAQINHLLYHVRKPSQRLFRSILAS